MTERTRKHPIQFYLSDDEQYILDEKFRLSKMRSKSAFLRKLVLYGFVYDVDYSHIREMNALLGNISGNLNQIAKRVNTTNTIYKKDMEDIKEHRSMYSYVRLSIDRCTLRTSEHRIDVQLRTSEHLDVQLRNF